MQEQWVPVNGFSRYMISDWGRVKSRETGLYVPATRTTGGVMIVQLYDDAGRPVARKLARLVCDGFHYNPDGYSEVLYKDGDKTNCRASNLLLPGDKDKPIPRRTKAKKPEPEKSLYIGLAEDETPPPARVPSTKRKSERVKGPVRVNQTDQVFSSVAEMSRSLGLDPSTVSKMLKNTSRQKSHRGLTFSYAHETSEQIPLQSYFERGGHPKRRIRVRETGMIYNSQAEVARELDVWQTRISAYLRGVSTVPVKGYTFEYVESADHGS